MIDYRRIYSQEAAKYDLLVTREDYCCHIRPAIAAIRPLEGLEVIELGAGTGRLTRLLAADVGMIAAFDISHHMLGVARSRLVRGGWHNWTLSVADNRQLPVRSAVADMAIAGWTLGHFTGWYGNNWQEEIDRAVNEMVRVLRPGGMLIILETLGTGRETPLPPTQGLADYYDYLESSQGFYSTWIRTDYRFGSLEEAEELTRFFFGRELADWLGKERNLILPECTGIWWKSIR